jgi:ACS family glucarate transporter-like MFS transporter
MSGKIGSFVTSLAFPYLLKWTGNPNLLVGAALNVLAALVWLVVRPERKIEEF